MRCSEDEEIRYGKFFSVRLVTNMNVSVYSDLHFNLQHISRGNYFISFHHIPISYEETCYELFINIIS